MGSNVKVILTVIAVLFLVLSCASKEKTAKTETTSAESSPKAPKISKKEELTPSFVRDLPPAMVPPTYKPISPFEGKTFTMSASGAPLTKVLYAIAEASGLNLIISPEVDTSKTITANFNEVPMEDALNIIMDMTGLYYEVKGNVLYVKELITKTYKIPYVAVESEYISSLGGDVLGSAISAGGGFGALGGTTGGGVGAGTIGGAGGSGLSGNFQIFYRTSEGSGDLYFQIENNLKKLKSKKGKFVLNRTTGTLIVTDRISNIKKIEKFLNDVLKVVKKQVLIEARIVEITLSDSFQFGIDWSAFFDNVFKSGGDISVSQTLSLQSGGVANISVVSSTFNALINALSTYGKVHALSNPRILVSNGQTALIATGVVTPFFERQVLNVVGQSTTQIQESIIKTTVLEGILLGVTPYIDDNGIITMNIIPVSTRLEGTKTLQVSGQVLAEAPIINVKESGTVVRVKDNELIVIGGLIGDVKGVDERKVPLLGDIPLLGNLFKTKRVYKEKRELIIFIKPTIVKHRDL